MYSIIEWKKGAPPKTDYYIVISKDGQVDVVRWYAGYWQCSFEVYGWREIWNVEIYNKEE